MLSSINPIQHGANKRLKSRKYETAITAEITRRIIKDILRKCSNSFLESGFSGVSRGQRQKIKAIDIMAMSSNTALKSYIFDNLIIPIEANIDSADNISHLVSVAA